MPRTSARAGFAVVAVLLLLLGLTSLAHAALVTAMRERQTGALEARLTMRRLSARSAASPPSGDDSLPTLSDLPRRLAESARAPLRWRTEAVALGPELALLTGVAEVDGLPGEARTGLVVWRLDPTARVAHADAVVALGGESDPAGGSLGRSQWLEPPAAAWVEACAEELAALDTVPAVAPAVVAPLAPGAGVGSAPGIGLLPGDSILAWAPVRLSGVVTPGPVTRGAECVDMPTNWGSPSSPDGPCGTRAVLVASDDDLTLVGGEAQGVVVARGSLTLAEGASFFGVVLVGGNLTLAGSARLTGLARVGGAVALRDGSRIDGSACAAARALRALPLLRRPLPLPEGSRVHPP